MSNDDPAMDDAELHALLIEFYRLIGYVASTWSVLELSMDEALWHLAGMEPEAGACVTAQFLSVRNRIDALMSLLELRAVGADIREKLDTFGKDCGSLAKRRNRVVHDPVVGHGSQPIAHRITIIAEKRLKFKFNEQAKIQDYEKTGTAIVDAIRRWEVLKAEIFVALPAYDKRPGRLPPANTGNA